jgi:hypothetical protein
MVGGAMSDLQATDPAPAEAAAIDLKLEVVVIPVADADRAKDFYASLGWRLDADFGFDNGFRVVQFTPPARRCRSSSARRSRLLRPVRPRASTSSSPTSRRPDRICSRVGQR